MEESEDSTGFSFLAILVIILIVLLVLGYSFYRIWEVQNQKQAIEMCRKSVELDSLAHIRGIETYDAIECPTRYLKISDANEEAIKKKVADQMADCWYKFGGDTNELFGRNLGTDRFCALCSHIAFQGSAKNRQLTGFSLYLAENKVKASYGGKSYLEYLTPLTLTAEDIEKLRTETSDVIDTHYDYGVIYVYNKYGKIDKATAAIGGGTAGLVAGTVVGIFFWPATVVAVPALLTATGGALIGSGAGADEPAEWSAAMMLTPYTEEYFNQLNCDKLPVRQDNK